jgi:hypothetical protein
MPTIVPKDDDPEALTDDMTAADLVDVLQRLPFPRASTGRGRPTSPAHCTISLDRGVRDYLVAAIKPRSPR